MRRSGEKRREKTFQILRQLDKHEISLAQAKAQLKDLGYEEWEIDLYIDGDADPEDYSHVRDRC